MWNRYHYSVQKFYGSPSEGAKAEVLHDTGYLTPWPHLLLPPHSLTPPLQSHWLASVLFSHIKDTSPQGMCTSFLSAWEAHILDISLTSFRFWLKRPPLVILIKFYSLAPDTPYMFWQHLFNDSYNPMNYWSLVIWFLFCNENLLWNFFWQPFSNICLVMKLYWVVSYVRYYLIYLAYLVVFHWLSIFQVLNTRKLILYYFDATLILFCFLIQELLLGKVCQGK